MESPFISILVPVYNAGLTIQACIESILAQNLSSFELLLINDGSTDNSAEICQKYAEGNPNIHFVSQPNGGASSARNTALRMANGTYIAFVDSDDALQGDWAELMRQIEAVQVDAYCYGVEYESGARLSWPLIGHFSSIQSLKPHLEEVLVTKGQIAVLYNKVFRKKLLQNIYFCEALKINEDLLFNLQALQNCGSIFFTSDCYYRYNDANNGSLSRRLRTDLLDAEELTRKAFLNFCEQCGTKTPEQNELLEKRRTDTARLQLLNLIWQQGKLPHNVRTQLIKRCCSVPHVPEIVLKELNNDKNRLLSFPYRFCIANKLYSALSVYCQLKSLFIR